MTRAERFDELIRKYGEATWEDAQKRLWSRIDQSAGEDACHPWTGKPMGTGYGQINIQIFGGHTSVHKLVYELIHGDVPPGYEIDHTCHNGDTDCSGGRTCHHRLCANPRHLEAVPPGENAARAHGPRNRGNQKTHCLHGHPYDEANTMWIKKIRNGRTYQTRMCRACNRDKAYRIKNGRERPADAMESLSRAGTPVCRRGHTYDEENTKYDSTTGKRRCRKCERLNDVNSKRRKKGLEPLTELPEVA